MIRGPGMGMAATACLLVVGCTASSAAQPVTTAFDGRALEWERLPRSPLGVRTQAAIASVADLVFVAGGAPFVDECSESGPACREVTPLADGAVFDTTSRQWRSIPVAPVSFWHATTVVVDREIYVAAWDRDDVGVVLRYSVDDEQWTQLPFDDRGLEIARFGNTVVKYQSATASGSAPMAALDLRTDEWVRLPPDPIGPSGGRSALWSGQYLYVFASATFDHISKFNPTFAVARFDPTTWTWKRLPDSPFVTAFSWFVDGDRAVNPTIGCQDDAPNGDPGQCYPHGGVFDFTDETWQPLPDAGRPDEGFALAAIGDTAAQYDPFPTASSGSSHFPVADIVGRQWVLLPSLGDDRAVRRRIVAAGLDPFVFGGIRLDGVEGNGLDDAWILRLGRNPAAPALDQVDIAHRVAERN